MENWKVTAKANNPQDIKNHQMEILELKNAITETENTLDRLNSRMESQ